MQHEDRYSELDALRGVAVLMMIAYHFAFDLAYFYGWNIAVLGGWWRLLARSTATLFLLLIGICFMISWSRARAPQLAPHRSERSEDLVLGWGATTHELTLFNAYAKYLRRGLIIFSGGMVISLVTWFVAPDAYVKFGILHLIGVAALLQPFFTQLGIWNVIPGVAIITAGIWVEQLTTTSRLFFPLGIPYSGFASLDYYPFLPWFGVILIGMAIGQTFYVPKRRFELSSLFLPAPRSVKRGVGWIGRKALILYFLHQPILLLLLRLTLGPALRTM